jgi:hypothetical protein
LTCANYFYSFEFEKKLEAIMARYFTEEEFKTEFDNSKVDGILKMLYKEEDVLPTQELSIEFFMMSNTMDKLDLIEEILEELGCDIDGSEQYEDGCELIAVSPPVLMTPDAVKAWYKKYWELGYQNDCKLDGWHVLVD